MREREREREREIGEELAAIARNKIYVEFF